MASGQRSSMCCIQPLFILLPAERSDEPSARVSMIFIFIFYFIFLISPPSSLFVALSGRSRSYRREDVFAGRGPAGVLCFKVIE